MKTVVLFLVVMLVVPMKTQAMVVTPNPHVSCLQTLLKKLDFYSGETHGIVDHAIKEALVEYARATNAESIPDIGTVWPLEMIFEWINRISLSNPGLVETCEYDASPITKHEFTFTR